MNIKFKQKLSWLAHTSYVTGSIGFLNLVFSGGNLWMIATGIILLIIAAIDVLHVKL